VIELARDTQRIAKVIGPDEHDIDTRHSRNLIDPCHRISGLDHHHDHTRGI